ncbi:hypothetical protein ACVMB3_005083 [Sinorhizobium meliloti]
MVDEWVRATDADVAVSASILGQQLVPLLDRQREPPIRGDRQLQAVARRIVACRGALERRGQVTNASQVHEERVEVVLVLLRCVVLGPPDSRAEAVGHGVGDLLEHGKLLARSQATITLRRHAAGKADLGPGREVDARCSRLEQTRQDAPGIGTLSAFGIEFVRGRGRASHEDAGLLSLGLVVQAASSDAFSHEVLYELVGPPVLERYVSAIVECSDTEFIRRGSDRAHAVLAWRNEGQECRLGG